MRGNLLGLKSQVSARWSIHSKMRDVDFIGRNLYELIIKTNKYS